MLGAYPWPGNIRQLENAVFRAVVLAESDSVGLGEFPQIAAQLVVSLPRPNPGAAEREPAEPTEDDEPASSR